MNWEVHKYGGSSLADSECIKNVANIGKDLQKPGLNTALVLSAMSGVTNSLILCLEYASGGERNSYIKVLEELKSKHVNTLSNLVEDKKTQAILSEAMDKDINDLKDILKAVSLAKTFTEANIDLVSGYGEIWSTHIMQLYLTSLDLKSHRLNARDILIINDDESIDWESSKQNIQKFKTSINDADYLVITGYIATLKNGSPTTLKRNGSDYSASIFGVLLEAKKVCIWTDVSGILSADPRIVENPIPLKEVSYLEALELAYFGAKVIHPNTMIPAIANNIPLYIKNTFKPNEEGTLIHDIASQQKVDFPVKGISSIDEVALINLEGTGMIGVPGIAKRVFSSLHAKEISVVLISQGSSEYSICFAVHRKDGVNSLNTIREEFSSDINNNLIQDVKLIDDCAIIAIVGDQMNHKKGIASAFFSSLAHADVNIIAIAQGSSERNISAVINHEDLLKAVRAVHSAFYFSNQTLSIGIVGTGLIGKTLYEQILDQKENLLKEFNIDLKIRAVCNSEKMILAKNINDHDVTQAYENAPNTNYDDFIKHLDTDHIPHCVLIDCTSNEKIADSYSNLLDKGIHIITPNKKACSGDLKYFQELQNFTFLKRSGSIKHKPAHFLYETTVGAGLPIISTLRELLKAGDKIIEVQGIVSGTLSYIFNELKPGVSFSSIVKKAKDLGYTEPNPAEDLSGLDVTRKIVILAREMGLDLDLKDIPTENLLPNEFQAITKSDDFFNKLHSLDAAFENKVSQAMTKNEVLRYVGHINQDQKCSVSLKSLPKDHPFANLKGSENCILFRTQRYNEYPLVIQGPGAGAQVTAGGVFIDILRLADLLGTSL